MEYRIKSLAKPDLSMLFYNAINNISTKCGTV